MATVTIEAQNYKRTFKEQELPVTLSNLFRAIPDLFKIIAEYYGGRDIEVGHNKTGDNAYVNVMGVDRTEIPPGQSYDVQTNEDIYNIDPHECGVRVIYN